MNKLFSAHNTPLLYTVDIVNVLKLLNLEVTYYLGK